MKKLAPDRLMSLEEYARHRPEYRTRVIAHKNLRRVPLGDNAALYFEDALTMQYQVQEMLRLERIFEPEGIAAELAVYNPLIPDGSNWKATFMLEYPDPEVRREILAQLVGIEREIWVQVGRYDPVYAIANEDLERSTADKTAAVHFLRFELTPAMVAAVKAGEPIRAGTGHPGYTAVTVLTEEARKSLAGDLD